jgi:4-amino-4-deoxy-L-arabinose transferase-like glycosyltransferase
MLLVLAVQLALIGLDRPAAPRPLFGDEITYLEAAHRLAATGESGLDPLWPPLYPRFLATALAAGGSLAAVRAAQLVLLAAAAVLLFVLVRRLARSTAAGALAAFFLLADPQVGSFAHYLWPEIFHLFLFLAAVWMLVRARDGDRRSWFWAAGAGVALGLALLAKSLLGPFLPFLLAPLVLGVGPERRRGLARAALAAAVALLTVFPAALASHRQGNGWWVGDSARFNLWVGLNDTSRRNLVGEIVGEEYARYRQSASTLPERNRILGEKIGALVETKGMGPLFAAQLGRQPFRLFDKDSFFTDQLPGGALAAQGYGYRGVPPALATALRLWSYALYAAVLAAAGLGMALLWVDRRRRGDPWLRGALLFLAYNLALFVFLHVKTRYRVQLLPGLDLYAAVAWAWWLGTDGDALRPRPTAAGWALAAAVAGLLLYFAFGGAWFTG